MSLANLKPKIFFILGTLILMSCSNDEIIPDTDVNDFLDYGLYWFDANNDSRKGFNEGNNTVTDVGSSYYDDSKPTMIYFHGWQPGTASDNYAREDFYFEDGDVNTVQFWKNKGWNVGVFYWNQFADEDEVKDAEAKIWSINGPRNMRYRLSDGSYSESQSPSTNLATLATNQLQTILAGNTSNNLRFAGHSLGSQLATYTAYILNTRINDGTESGLLKVDRLELLDPFWSSGTKNFLNDDWTGERVRTHITDMIDRDDLAVTWYSSSLILNTGVGDSNTPLKDIVAFQNIRLWYVNAIDIAAKHVNVRHHYFWSVNFDAPKEVAKDSLNMTTGTGNVAASATTEISRIRNMMGDKNTWDQVEGRYTPTPADDEFELK